MIKFRKEPKKMEIKKIIKRFIETENLLLKR